MANTQSAIKRIRISRRRQIRNQTVRSAVRTHIKNARLAIDSNASDVDERVARALSLLDRAVTKGVFHRNNAARRKSRLLKRLHKARPAA